MDILALDLATKTGFARADSSFLQKGAGEGRLVSGTHRLRGKDDDANRGCRRLGIWLRDQFTISVPELVIVEAPVPIGAMIDRTPDEDGKIGLKFRSNPETIAFLQRIVGGVQTICGPYGIRCELASAQTVRKTVLGNARPPDAKRAVVQWCHTMRYMERTDFDDNRADAIALAVYAAIKFARSTPAQLVMDGERDV